MDIPLDEVIYVEAISSSSTGAAADADSTPTFAVYEESTDTDIGVGGNMTKRTSLTGNYRASFTASAANGFELGKWYSVIGSATIGGVACKGILARFRIVAAENVAGYPVGDAVKVAGQTNPATNLNTIFNTDYSTVYDTTNKAFLSKLGNFAMGGSSLNLTLNNLAVGGTATFTGAVTASNASNSINLGTDAINATVLAASAVSEMQSGLATASALSTVQADTDDIQTRLPTALGANGNMKADVRDFSGTAGTFSGGRPEVILGASQNATTFASLTVTGRLQVSDGIDVSCSTAHRNALVLTGNGSGAAARMVGGSGGGNVLTMLSGGGSPTAMIYVGPGGLSTPGLTIDVFGNAIEARSGAGIGIWAYGATAGARFENTGTGPAVSLIAPDGHGIDASTSVVGGFGISGTIDGAITNSGLAPSSTALSTANWTNTRAGYLDKLANLPTDPADASDIAALFSTLTSHGDSAWATATGFAVAGDSMALTTTERNNVAAVTLRRSMANVEAAAVGDTLTKSSLYGSIQQAQRSNTTDNVGSLTIYKTGGTELGRLTLATASSVDQITGVS